MSLVQGPPGTGKTTTLVWAANALHLAQFRAYYGAVRAAAVRDDACAAVAGGRADPRFAPYFNVDRLSETPLRVPTRFRRL